MQIAHIRQQITYFRCNYQHKIVHLTTINIRYCSMCTGSLLQMGFVITCVRSDTSRFLLSFSNLDKKHVENSVCDCENLCQLNCNKWLVLNPAIPKIFSTPTMYLIQGRLIKRCHFPVSKNRGNCWEIKKTRGPWWPCNAHLSNIALWEPDLELIKANILIKMIITVFCWFGPVT